MKVIKDGKGKYIVDFEGLEIDLSDIGGESCGIRIKPVKVNLTNNRSDGGLGGVQSLFNDDVVSNVRNGVFLFDKPHTVPLQAPESPVEA